MDEEFNPWSGADFWNLLLVASVSAVISGLAVYRFMLP
jgi:hypothetical protein